MTFKVLTWEEVIANRIKWCDYMDNPELTKTQGRLQSSPTSACCLGHGCACFKLEYEEVDGPMPSGILYKYLGEMDFAPQKFMYLVGLFTSDGVFKDENEYNRAYSVGEGIYYSLAQLNDGSTLSTQEISTVIRSLLAPDVLTSPFIRTYERYLKFFEGYIQQLQLLEDKEGTQE